MRLVGAILAALATGAGCTEPAEEEIRPAMPIADESDADDPSDDVLEDDFDGSGYADIDGFRFKIPEDWKRVELTPTQQGIISARYLIPVDDEELQITFSLVKGGIEANFQRWIGQFQLDPETKPMREWLTVDGAEAEWIELRGQYLAGSSGGSPSSNDALLGAGIPIASGELYLKLTGPAEKVDRVKEAVRETVLSARLP